MALEIERKWRVDREVANQVMEGAIAGYEPHAILVLAQAYLAKTTLSIARVRTARDVVSDLRAGYITVKGPSDVPGAVEEHEMEISFASADSMISECGKPVIRKTRFVIPHGELKIELDVFTSNGLDGLVIAEVEFPEPGVLFTAPEWFGDEITGQSAYSNASLAEKVK